MVSVIIPTYNRAAVIEKSMRSVLDQSYKDLELIIIDDGSSDATKSVVESINDKRVRYFFQNNSGACAARNKGIMFAQGEYIAFHDSDDIWFPDKLKRQIETIEATGADIVFCQLKRCNMNEGVNVIPEFPESGFVNYHDLMVGISTQTLFMKREVVEHIKFDTHMPRFQDLEWLLRAVKRYSLYGMKEVLVDYYFSGDSITMSGRKLLKAVLLICRKYPNLSGDVPNVYEGLTRLTIGEGLTKLKAGNDDYKKYLLLGFSLSEKPVDKLKLFLVRIGIFKKLYDIRHFND